MFSINKFISTLKRDRDFHKSVKPCITHCTDSLSKSILYARINYYSEFLSNYHRILPFHKAPFLRFHNRINRLTSPQYRIEELDQFHNKRLVILGEGDDLKYTLSLLKRSSWQKKFRSIGTNFEEVGKIKKDEILIPAKLTGLDEFIKQIKKSYPNVSLYRPNGCLLWALTGNQYLDVFSPRDKEVVIDCGAYDGQTELDFFKWGKGHIHKIYAFELDPFNKDKCINFYKQHNLSDYVEFINKGTSNSNCTIHLASSSIGSTASHIGEGGQVAEVVKIDDAVKDNVSFIKMDVEGAELDSLKGAEITIKNNKPRLAICLYHKKSDIYEIPNYLLSIIPSYHFVVRHYSSNPWETVLYAFTND